MKVVTVRLDDVLAERLRLAAGKRGMNGFATRAIEASLEGIVRTRPLTRAFEMLGSPGSERFVDLAREHRGSMLPREVFVECLRRGIASMRLESARAEVARHGG